MVETSSPDVKTASTMTKSSPPPQESSELDSQIAAASGVNFHQDFNGNNSANSQTHAQHRQQISERQKAGPGSLASSSKASSSSSLTSKSTSNSSGSRERPLAEIISEHFSSFDVDRVVVHPFNDESARDAKFEEDLNQMLLNVILTTHAWASARPKHEADLESQKLEDQAWQIMETEREQEQTRERLGEFVKRMKTALAALTGTAF